MRVRRARLLLVGQELDGIREHALIRQIVGAEQVTAHDYLHAFLNEDLLHLYFKRTAAIG